MHAKEYLFLSGLILFRVCILLVSPPLYYSVDKPSIVMSISFPFTAVYARLEPLLYLVMENGLQ